MKVSIIIPTYNHFSDLLRPCLESIEKYTNLSDKEIIIVSNGSTDDTIPYIEYKKRCGLPYKLLDFPRPIGFPKAINIGALASQGDFLAVVNNDIEILPSVIDAWTNIMLEPFVRPDVAVSGPVQVTNDITNRVFILFFCALIKRSIFEQLNGLDEIFSPGYGDDVDFCIRAKLKGYKCIKVPEGGRIEQDGNITLVDFPIKHISFATFKESVKLSERIKKSNDILYQRYGRKEFNKSYGTA
jgi:GT2 family glycosyltransferase